MKKMFRSDRKMKPSKEQKFREELFSEKLKVNIAYDTGKEQGIKQGRLEALKDVEKIIDEIDFRNDFYAKGIRIIIKSAIALEKK